MGNNQQAPAPVLPIGLFGCLAEPGWPVAMMGRYTTALEEQTKYLDVRNFRMAYVPRRKDEEPAK